MAYIPTTGPLLGKQWNPSNGSEGTFFMDAYCSKCARDKAMREGCDFDDCADDDLCEIIAAAFRGQAVEWRELPDGDVTCIAFVPAEEPRDDRTIDMFETLP